MKGLLRFRFDLVSVSFRIDCLEGAKTKWRRSNDTRGARLDLTEGREGEGSDSAMGDVYRSYVLDQ